MGVPWLCFSILGKFVRKKQNKIGVISVQIVYKITGKFRMLKTIGSSADT
jgi:hypothetical protein